MRISLSTKLAILADAAKYDASCASSGSTRRDSRMGGIGSTEGNGICHSYAPDGRCISLLKILLTNFCIYDCAYCVNRRSSNIRRARFSVDEVVQLTLAFYKRNYIEGMFLSSGIIRNPDYTMEELIRVARTLREDHQFRGYIHLKTIPNAAQELVEEAGCYADRVSINVELPSEAALGEFAPEKCGQSIRRAMAGMRLRIDAARAEKRRQSFAPAGQSTQMIVGADGSDDRTILTASTGLYSSYGLKRVYYSAFSPIPDSSARLPLKATPLLREQRLYQADWLYRFYGFAVEDILPANGERMLDLEIDPKLAWALRHREWFPIDLNRGSREELLRVPGLGVRSVERILKLRRRRVIRLEELARLRISVSKIAPFVVSSGGAGSATSRALLDRIDLKQLVAARQLSLFGHV